MEIKMSGYEGVRRTPESRLTTLASYDDPEVDIDCPVCNTLDVVELGRNAYRCRDCGTVFRGE